MTVEGRSVGATGGCSAGSVRTGEHPWCRRRGCGQPASLQRPRLAHFNAGKTAVAALPIHVHETPARSYRLLLAGAHAVVIVTPFA